MKSTRRNIALVILALCSFSGAAHAQPLLPLGSTLRTGTITDGNFLSTFLPDNFRLQIRSQSTSEGQRVDWSATYGDIYAALVLTPKVHYRFEARRSVASTVGVYLYDFRAEQWEQRQFISFGTTDTVRTGILGVGKRFVNWQGKARIRFRSGHPSNPFTFGIDSISVWVMP
ncbi:MAG TPA: hypothetical protein PLH94_03420 [Fimbriimonadaceae bacterium]|nr:hypothetical protein [Fimbriimonadaceae bacterium]